MTAKRNPAAQRSASRALIVFSSAANISEIPRSLAAVQVTHFPPQVAHLQPHVEALVAVHSLHNAVRSPVAAMADNLADAFERLAAEIESETMR